MTPFHLSRRQLLLSGGGIVVSGIVGTPRFAVADQLSVADKDLIFHSTDIRNGEPELEKLVGSWLTPTKHFYVRSHAPNPVIDPNDFQLSVEGLVRNPTSISLHQLNQMTNHTITATLTCAGNRRAEFNAEGKVGGVQWGPGAIGNATWTGVALVDLLKKAEVLDGAKHVWFEGLDEIQRDDGVIPFGGSVPIEKAMINGSSPGVLLAQKMNGQALTPDHGFPLRTVVPGYIGARSVKWLGRIVVSDRPSPNHYVDTAYKIVKQTAAIDWAESGPIYRFPINGAIATPVQGASLSAGQIEVTGYVLPSGRPGATVQRVLISADEGKSWKAAKLTGENADYCWQLWKATVDVTAESKQLLMKAHDTAGDFMPGRVPWNAKGYLQNAWYRHPIQVE